MPATNHDDAVRVAKRLHELTLERWEDVGVGYRSMLVEALEGLITAEIIFPGPSLYAESSV